MGTCMYYSKAAPAASSSRIRWAADRRAWGTVEEAIAR